MREAVCIEGCQRFAETLLPLVRECQPNKGVVCECDNHVFVAVRNPDWMTRSAMNPRSYRRLR